MKRACTCINFLGFKIMNGSNGTGNDTGIEIQLQPVKNCVVAYTLDGYQPVRSSYIGEEPLFFMDTDEVIDDEALFEALLAKDIEGMETLESDIASLSDKMAVYDRFINELSLEKTDITSAFAGNADDVTAYLPDTADIEILLEKARHSRLLSTLLDFAAERNTGVAYNLEIDTSEYDKNAQTVFINSQADLSYQLLLLARELRRVWQYKSGTHVDPLALYPDHGILVNRLQEADVAACMIRCGWELQLAGEKQVWALIENSSMQDLGRAFARDALTDFRTLHNGDSALSIFETWFLSERCRKYDRKLIQRMLAEPERQKVQMNEDVSRQTCMSLIAALGEMPYGKNYLARHARFIMDDPIFSEVRDRSNANFLWFIKFENAYDEAEQNLQESNAPIQAAQLTNHKTGQIVAFPNTKTASRCTNKKTANGQVIPLLKD